MHDLTQRQVNILKQIIREYIDTAEPVGSETLEKRYDLGVSPATIRNEMVEMERLGYLKKAHASSGRIPTSKSLKLYVDELMKERELSTAEEVEAKEKIWDYRDNEERFLRETTKNLAHKTKALAVALNEGGDVFFSGYSNILEMPEFYDIDITKNLLNMLDEYSCFNTIMGRIEDDFGIFFGEEFEQEMFRPYSFIFSRFHTKKDHRGSIGVVGPTRLRFDSIVPVVRYFGGLIEEVADW